MTDYSGIALIITPIVAGIVTIVTLLVNHRTVKRVEVKVDEVNHAVNGKDPRDTTLSEDVITIRDKQEVDLPSSDISRVGLVPAMRELHAMMGQLLKEVKTGNGH